VLDADTRSYLQLLTEQAGIALHGTGGVLGGALHELAPLSSEARKIGSMLAERSGLIAKLVGESTAIFQTLGHRHAELAQVLGAGTRLLSVTGSRTREISLATRALPAVLAQGQATSRAITSLAPALEQALTDLSPATAAFASGLRSTRGAIPSLDRFLNAAASLTRGTAQPGRDLLRLAQHLGDGIGPAVASYRALEVLLQSLAAHQHPISNFSEAISGVTSTQDAYGPLGRIKLIGIQAPTAEDLGLTGAATAHTQRGHSGLETMLAAALGALCEGSQPFACVLAVATPGLPGSLVPRRDGVMGVLSKTPGGIR
jgi:ABC-type transporter Mla subunit MlaD